MKTAFAVIGFVAVALVVGTCVACNDDDSNSLGRIELVSHQYRGCDPNWDECYDRGGDRGDYSGDQDYDQWNNEQRNHNRRNRGAFSPGPFQDSPVTIIICPPGTQYCGSDGGRGNQPPPEGRS